MTSEEDIEAEERGAKMWHPDTPGRIRSLSICADARAARKALELIVRYVGIDGEHHKAWVIDQVARVLAGDGYDELVREAKAGEDGPETYGWDVGIPP